MFPRPIETWKPSARALYILSVFIVLLGWLLPLIIISIASFMTADQLNSGGRGLNMPNPFSVDGWTTAIKNDEFRGSFINSFFIVLPVVAISVGLATMAGFALSKYRFRGQLLIFAIFIG